MPRQGVSTEGDQLHGALGEAQEVPPKDFVFTWIVKESARCTLPAALVNGCEELTKKKGCAVRLLLPCRARLHAVSAGRMDHTRHKCAPPHTHGTHTCAHDTNTPALDLSHIHTHSHIFLNLLEVGCRLHGYSRLIQQNIVLHDLSVILTEGKLIVSNVIKYTVHIHLLLF